MNIKHEHIQLALLAWAAEVGQAHAAERLAETYHEIGGGKLPLTPGKTWNNQQNLFRPDGGWVYGRTHAQREKIRELLPSIFRVLPREIRHRLSIYDTISRRALVAAQGAIGKAIDAHDDAIESVYLDSRRDVHSEQPQFH